MECKACVDGIRLEHVSELGSVLDESGIDEAQSVVGKWQVLFGVWLMTGVC